MLEEPVAFHLENHKLGIGAWATTSLFSQGKSTWRAKEEVRFKYSLSLRHVVMKFDRVVKILNEGHERSCWSVQIATAPGMLERS